MRKTSVQRTAARMAQNISGSKHMELIQRFEESIDAYNRASGLMDKGRLDEAESLLQTALAIYPREILMDEDFGVDASIKESFEALFGNIRDRIETIQALKGGGRQTSLYVTNLRDLVEMNIARKREAPVETAREQEMLPPPPVGIPSEAEEPPGEAVEPAPGMTPADVFVEEEFPDPEDVRIGPEETFKEPAAVPDIGAEFDSGVIDAAEKATERIEHPEFAPESNTAEPAEEDTLMEEAIEAAMFVEGHGEPASPPASKEPAEDELSPEETVRSVSDLADHIAASLKHPPKDGYEEMSPRDAAVKAVAAAVEVEEESETDTPQEDRGAEAYTAPQPEPVFEKSAAVSAAEAASAEAEALAAQAEAAVAEAEEHGAEQAFPEPAEPVQTEQTTEEDSKSEMPTQPDAKKPNLFKAMSLRLASFKSLLTRKKKEEEPKTEDAEEPAAETIEPEQEAAPAPPPAEEPPAQDDKDDEALLDEDEMRKLKERHAKKQPISVSTPINASGIFGTILVILMFIIGGYLLHQGYTATNELETAYVRGRQAALAGNTGIEYAVAYQGLLGGIENTNSAMAYIVAGWGDGLFGEQERQPEAAALFSVFRKQGLTSVALDDEFAAALTEASSAKLRAGDEDEASKLFAKAVDLLKGSMIPEARAHAYKTRLSRIGYLLASRQTEDDPPAGTENLVRLALSRLVQLKNYLNDKERMEIQRKADQVAGSILAEGQAALKKNDAALAGRLASQALEMNPSSRAAAALLKNATGKNVGKDIK